ncbi:uncharacterized protein LOC144865739 [Branchiostoma floridae x Branchiostoma japonicum]
MTVILAETEGRTMLSARPPKKPGGAACGREDDPRTRCRLCQKSLLKNGKISNSKNLFELKSKGKDQGKDRSNEEPPAPKLEKLLGTAVVRDPSLSESICEPCGRKIDRFIRDDAAETLSRWRRAVGPGGAVGGVALETFETANVSDTTTATSTNVSTTPARLLVTTEPRSPMDVTRTTPKSSAKKRRLIYTPGKFSPAHKQRSRPKKSHENVPPLQKASQNFAGGDGVTKVEVHVQYPSDKGPRVKKMGGRLKSGVQQLADGKWGAAAGSLLKHEEMAAALRDKVAQAIKQEGNVLAAVSVLGRTQPKDLLNFKLEDFEKELEIHAPWFDCCLQGACGEDRRIAICTAASVCLRARHPTLSAIQYRNSLVLLHAGAKKIAFTRLNKQQLCMSHTMSILKQTELGKGRDDKILAWKRRVEAHMETVPLLVALGEELVKQARVKSKAVLDASGQSTISSADLQELDFAFQTYDSPEQPSLSVDDSDLEQPSLSVDDSDLDLGVMPLSEEDTDTTKPIIEVLNSIPGYKDETYKLAEQAINSAEVTTEDRPQDIVSKAVEIAAKTPLPTFQIIFDNVDLNVTAKHQSAENRNQSLHWIQQFGALDRVKSPPSAGPQRQLRDFQLEEVMVTDVVQHLLRGDFIILVSHVLVERLAAFRGFRDVVVRHIRHQYSDEMEQPSEQTWLGLQFKNENKGRDMADILRYIQTNYVPSEVDEDGNITHLVQPILLGGDWLSEERAEGVQAGFRDGDSAEERLEGMSPKHELWHGKMNLDEIMFGIFGKPSAADIASLTANMNVIGASNARKGPHAANNAYQEFMMKDFQAFIIHASKKIFHLQSVDDAPEAIVPDQILGGDEHTRRDWLHSRAAEIVDIAFHEEVASINRIVEGIQDSRYHCRQEGCTKSFVRAKARSMHEVKKHNLHVSARTNDDSTEDGVYNYHSAKFGMALLLHNLKDATREGDGERVARCLKMALLFFRAYGHTKYAMGTFLFFARQTTLLPANLAHSLKWNRFINNAGGKGKNMPMDLRLENMNGLFKAFAKHLGPNLNEASAARIANAIGELEAMLNSIDFDLGVTRAGGYHHKGDPTEDILKLVEQYDQCNVLQYQPGRQYACFPGFKRDLLAKLDVKQMANWMRTKLKHWEALYE